MRRPPDPFWIEHEAVPVAIPMVGLYAPLIILGRQRIEPDQKPAPGAPGETRRLRTLSPLPGFLGSSVRLTRRAFFGGGGLGHRRC